MVIQDIIKVTNENMSPEANYLLQYVICDLKKTEEPETEIILMQNVNATLKKWAKVYFRSVKEVSLYMRDFAKNDVSEAVDNGCKTITSIANYYLFKEAKNAISNYIEYNFSASSKEYRDNLFRQN